MNSACGSNGWLIHNHWSPSHRNGRKKWAWTTKLHDHWEKHYWWRDWLIAPYFPRKSWCWHCSHLLGRRRKSEKCHCGARGRHPYHLGDPRRWHTLRCWEGHHCCACRQDPLGWWHWCREAEIDDSSWSFWTSLQVSSIESTQSMLGIFARLFFCW